MQCEYCLSEAMENDRFCSWCCKNLKPPENSKNPCMGCENSKCEYREHTKEERINEREREIDFNSQ